MRRLLAAAVAVGALVLWGVGCGGGGPTAPPAPPPPPPGVTFTAAGPAGNDTIHLAQAASGSRTTLRLEVRASTVTGLFGLGFDLEFPEALLQWSDAGTAEGDFLNGDGSATELLVTENPAGNLIVGLSRLGQVGGVDGSGLLLTLEFTAVANGTGAFAFAANEALDEAGMPLANIEWLAGDVRVILP